MNKDNIVSIIVVLIVVGAIGYGVFALGGNFSGISQSKSVATVNGVAITQQAFDTQLTTALESLKAQGIDTASQENLAQIKTQLLNDMINNELVNQEIAKAGIKVADADVDAQVSVAITQVGGELALDAELAKANITKEQFRENLSKQLAIQTYLSQNINLAGVTATEQEILEFYNTNGGTEEGAPKLVDIKEQIRQQIIFNKQQQLVSQFVETLRSKATIETNL